MTKTTEHDLLNLLEELRGLSFRVSETSRKVGADQERVEDLVMAMTEVSQLHTCFEKRTTSVDEKIEKMKSLMD